MNLAERFQQLDLWLTEHQQLWRAKPFIEHRCGWEARHPELAAWLRSRTLEQAEQAHNEPHRLDAPTPFGDLAREAVALAQVPDWSATPSADFPERLYRHIPGRKWQQITRFAQVSQLRLQQPVRHWVDWCAGKGHLGRLLAWQSGLPSLLLERDEQLNIDGSTLSQALGLEARHQAADVLAPQTWRYLERHHSLVALHACGQLHMTLLQQAVTRGCAQVALAPCCYNRIEGISYQQLSRVAQAALLQPTRDDLGLPMQESVTAGRRTRNLRDRSMAWRLAFDLWQREARGVEAYLPTPSLAQSALGGDMPGFCRALAAHHALTLPEPESWAELEGRGWQRLAEVRNLELVRGLFRRPLEMWLLLDRALYLQEAGYRVELGTFCPSLLTPRNILLIAERPFAQPVTSL